MSELTLSAATKNLRAGSVARTQSGVSCEGTLPAGLAAWLPRTGGAPAEACERASPDLDRAGGLSAAEPHLVHGGIAAAVPEMTRQRSPSPRMQRQASPRVGAEIGRARALCPRATRRPDASRENQDEPAVGLSDVCVLHRRSCRRDSKRDDPVARFVVHQDRDEVTDSSVFELLSYLLDYAPNAVCGDFRKPLDEALRH